MAAQNVRTFVASYGVDSNPCSRTAPCRNFAAAIAETNPEGEVVALDSSGYGPVIIGQSVTIVAPFGVHAAIAPTSGAAVAINAGSFDTVTLRGLYLNSQGALVGIDFDAGRTLHIENCVVSGFGTAGIQVSRVVSNFAEVFVRDTTVRDTGNDGIFFRNPAVGALIRAVIDGCHLVRNGFGVGGAAGLSAEENSRVIVRDTISSRSTVGFSLWSLTANTTAAMTVVDCVATLNSYGLDASTLGTGAVAIMRVSNSTIVENSNGVTFSGAGASIESRGDNTLEGNNASNVFADSYSPK